METRKRKEEEKDANKENRPQKWQRKRQKYGNKNDYGKDRNMETKSR